MRAIVSALMAVLLAAPGLAQDCTESFGSTFEMVQELIFERHGCTAATCHSGPSAGGGLDLSASVSWDNLFEVAPTTVEAGSLQRVTPNDKQNSLLWLNLASAVFPDRWEAPLRSMPLGGAAPLSFDELELLKYWIEKGALRTGVVPETADLFDDVCLPPLQPLEAEPLAPPETGIGVQLRAPRLDLPAHSETEVCFTSYYDFSDIVPPESLTEDGKFFVARGTGDRADPLTHHQTVNAYQGATPIDDPIWGAFTCKHGPREGESCDPKDAETCGEPGACGSVPVRSVACIGYGPSDAGFGGNNQFTLVERRKTSEGDSVILVPVKSVVIWNSHSFNVTPSPGKIDRWLNFEFVDASELGNLRQTQQIITQDKIFQAGAPAYGLRETCAEFVVPEDAELEFLSFHTHKRGARWRTFGGEFRCRGGANANKSCSPLLTEDVPDICSGAPCAAYAAARAGDCDGDNLVSISELTTGVGIALGTKGFAACPQFDMDGSRSVAVFELVAAVQSALEPRELEPQKALMYSGFDYADPFRQLYDPPLVLGAKGTSAADRTLTFCGLYDNGFSDPADVVRNSTRPTNAGSCVPTHCAEGRVGERCSRGNNSVCDTAAGAGDGFCDACSSAFGLTTDDEMFLLIGSYVEPPQSDAD